MKNTLNSIALLFTVAYPAAFLAEISGLPLPGPVNSSDLFVAFVGCLLLKIGLLDYAAPAPALAPRPAAIVGLPSQSVAKILLPLAA